MYGICIDGKQMLLRSLASGGRDKQTVRSCHSQCTRKTSRSQVLYGYVYCTSREFDTLTYYSILYCTVLS